MKKYEDLSEKKLSGERIYSGKVLNLERDDIELPDGKSGVREVIRHPGAVCVVPLTDEGEVVCVRQFRYPHTEVLLEVPAGKLEAGETDVAEAARRELREETGARCGKLTYLGKLYPSPAIIDEVIHMFLAEELVFGADAPDDDEFILVDKLPLAKLVDMTMNGEIPDSKTQIAALKVSALLAKRRER